MNPETPSDVPAAPFDWKEVMKEAVQKVMDTEKPSSKFISLRAGVIRYNDQPAKDNKLPCIIVGWAFENQMFFGEFDPDNFRNPDCYALSDSGENMAPPAGWPTPEAGACTDCKYHKWASDLKGGRGKACKEIRRLSLICFEPGSTIDVPKSEVLIMRIPVMSVDNWSQYVRGIGHVDQRAPWGVVTEVSTVPDAKSMFRVTFKKLGFAPEAMMEDLYHLHVRQQTTDILVPYEPNPPESETAKADAPKPKTPKS